jgi:hypothetical protein
MEFGGKHMRLPRSSTGGLCSPVPAINFDNGRKGVSDLPEDVDSTSCSVALNGREISFRTSSNVRGGSGIGTLLHSSL